MNIFNRLMKVERMMASKNNLSMLAMVLFAACTPTTQSNTSVTSTKPNPTTLAAVPTEYKEMAFNVAFAMQIARQCNSGFRLDREKINKTDWAIRAKYPNVDFKTVGKNLELSTGDQKELQSRIIQYVGKRDILVNSEASWCAAGSAEVREGTAIGAFLKEI